MTPVLTPSFVYGTAWKEARTEELTLRALAAGFRAIDTANQRKHYYEAGVGAAIERSKIARDELFLQTKFTYERGQDQRLPYDPKARLSTQVRQSFESSLEHLRVETIDCYVLHGPWSASGWTGQDQETWGAMESLHAAGRARQLGVSNVTLEQLRSLCQLHSVPPAFVQNRCYARTGWDRELRAFCRQHAITYQGFSLLTANARELAGPVARAIAQRMGATVPQVVFAFAVRCGILPLTGTSNVLHMQQDLASSELALTPADRDAIESIAAD
jgi:diketogulonate reductase-like aldo/keto reductase